MAIADALILHERMLEQYSQGKSPRGGLSIHVDKFASSCFGNGMQLWPWDISEPFFLQRPSVSLLTLTGWSPGLFGEGWIGVPQPLEEYGIWSPEVRSTRKQQLTGHFNWTSLSKLTWKKARKFKHALSEVEQLHPVSA